MERRGFLKTLFGGATVMALDPERLLWVPGKKLISVPAVIPSALAGNHFLTTQQITFEMLKIFNKHLTFVTSQQYSRNFDRFRQTKLGDYLSVRHPSQFVRAPIGMD